MKKESTLTLTFTDYDSLEDLVTSDQELLKEAVKVAEKAYAPYSDFQVGAAVRLKNDTIVCGSNQENVAYPSGLCAERVALFAVGANHPDEAIDTLAVYAQKSIEGAQISPCGSCRQVMVESERRQKGAIRLLLMNSEGRVRAFQSCADLLPFAFRFASLKKA